MSNAKCRKVGLKDGDHRMTQRFITRWPVVGRKIVLVFPAFP